MDINDEEAIEPMEKSLKAKKHYKFISNEWILRRTYIGIGFTCGRPASISLKKLTEIV